MKNPQSKLGQLQHKFFYSGLNGNPVITDTELTALSKQLEELALYFTDRNDLTISYALKLEQESVNRMIYARKH